MLLEKNSLGKRDERGEQKQKCYEKRWHISSKKDKQVYDGYFLIPREDRKGKSKRPLFPARATNGILETPSPGSKLDLNLIWFSVTFLRGQIHHYIPASWWVKLDIRILFIIIVRQASQKIPLVASLWSFILCKGVLKPIYLNIQPSYLFQTEY